MVDQEGLVGDASEDGDIANLLTITEGFVGWANESKVGTFDFSVRSLADFDALLARILSNGPIPAERQTTLWPYVGEVMVRSLGGHWGAGDDFGKVLPPSAAPVDAVPAMPVAFVSRRIEDGLSVRRQVIECGQTWEGIPTPPAEALDPNDPASVMAHSADAFIRSAEAWGVDWLDYSGESVMRLDGLIDEWWPRPRKGTHESMVPTIGAYVGEVLIRTTGAHWVSDDAEGYGIELVGTAYPLNKVAKRFERGRDHSIGQFYREVSNHWLSGNDAIPAAWKPVPHKRRWPFSR